MSLFLPRLFSTNLATKEFGVGITCEDNAIVVRLNAPVQIAWNSPEQDAHVTACAEQQQQHRLHT